MVPGWGIDPVSRVQPGFIVFFDPQENHHGMSIVMSFLLDDMGQPHFRKPPNLIAEII